MLHKRHARSIQTSVFRLVFLRMLQGCAALAGEGGKLATLDELDRLTAVLAAFPTTEAQDQRLLQGMLCSSDIGICCGWCTVHRNLKCHELAFLPRLLAICRASVRKKDLLCNVGCGPHPARDDTAVVRISLKDAFP